MALVADVLASVEGTKYFKVVSQTCRRRHIDWR